MHICPKCSQGVFTCLRLRALTESCPDRYWGASLSMLGLMGDVTEMDGRSIFWDSKELEPDGVQTEHIYTNTNTHRDRNTDRLVVLFVLVRRRDYMRELMFRRREPKSHFQTFWLCLVKDYDKPYLIPVVHVCCLVSLEYPWNGEKEKVVSAQDKGRWKKSSGGVRGVWVEQRWINLSWCWLHSALMTLNTALVFMQSAAPSATKSRSDIRIGKSKCGPVCNCTEPFPFFIFFLWRGKGCTVHLTVGHCLIIQFCNRLAEDF